MLRMSSFLIGKDITETPAVSKHSFAFNPFYSEGRIHVLYQQNLLSTIKREGESIVQQHAIQIFCKSNLKPETEVVLTEFLILF